MAYQLYVVLSDRWVMVAEKGFISDIYSDMDYMEDMVREQYKLGIVHWLVYQGTIPIDERFRLWGCEV